MMALFGHFRQAQRNGDVLIVQQELDRDAPDDRDRRFAKTSIAYN